MPEPNLLKYVKKETPKKTTALPSDDKSDIGDYAAMFVRGVAGFAPGGFIGAGVGGAAEVAAQTLEGRPEINWPTVGAEAAIGAIPFHGAATLGKAALKGAGISIGGTALRQQTEEGLHVPNLQDAQNLAISGVLGGAGGAVASKVESHFVNRPPKEKANAEVANVVAHIKETPKPTITERKVEVQISPELQKANQRLYDLAKQSIIGPLSPEERAEAAALKRYVKDNANVTAQRIRKNETKVGHDIIDTTTGEVIPPSAQLPETPTAKTVNRTTTEQSKFEQLWNLPKSTSASGDLSFGFRQGLPFARRKEWRDSWMPMIKAARTEEGYERLNAELLQHPDYKDAVASGLKFTSLGDDVAEREEQFFSTLAHKIPVLGPLVFKPSERAFNAFGNNLKLKVFSSLKNDAAKAQATVSNAELADYVNMMTGRGNIAATMSGKSDIGERAARFLNMGLFSPRFLASRVQMLNPVTYVKMDPFTRKQALKDLGAMAGFAGGALWLADTAGAEVTADPTSSDFGKIKIGKTRIDALGGFGQYITLYSRLAQHLSEKDTWKGTKKNTSKADLVRFAESKSAPTVSMIKEIFSGKDYVGNKVKPQEAVWNAFVPMLVKDFVETYKEDKKNLALTSVGVLGIPVSTYGSKGGRSMFGATSTRRPNRFRERARLGN